MLPVFPQELQDVNGVDPYYSKVFRHIPGDEFFETDTCELLIHGEGGNGYGTITDSSKNVSTVTLTGTPILSTGVTPPYGNTSIYLDGSPEYFKVAKTLGSGPWTIQGWFNFSSLPPADTNYTSIVSFHDAGGWGTYLRLYNTSGTVNLQFYAGTTTSWNIASGILSNKTNWSINTWYHIALVFTGYNYKVYIDGVEDTALTVTSTSVIKAQTEWVFGYHTATYPGTMTGYIKDACVHFEALYKSNFTPPTSLIAPKHKSNDPFWYNTEFLLESSGIDNETVYFDKTQKKTFSAGNYGTVIDKAVYFNGTANYITLSSDFGFGTSDFTIEADIYNERNNSSGEQVIAEQYTGSGDTTWAVGYYTDGKIGFGWYNGSTWTWVQDTVVSPYNSWLNVKAIRKNGVMYLYLNNTLANSGACTYNFPTDNPVYVGRRWDTSGTYIYFKGYIKNLRVTKGIARDITDVPKPFKPINESTGALVSPYSNVFPTPSAAANKFRKSSLYFNGSSSAIVQSINSKWLLGTLDFTLETWFKIDSGAPAYGAFLLIGATQATGVNFKYNNSTTYNFYIYNGPTTTTVCVTANNVVKAGKWQHVAYQRRNGIFYIYVDGILQGSNASYTGTSIGSSSTNPLIGYSGNTGEWFKGWMNDWRFTLGIARYTGNNIEVPRNAFPSRGGNI